MNFQILCYVTNLSDKNKMSVGLFMSVGNIYDKHNDINMHYPNINCNGEKVTKMASLTILTYVVFNCLFLSQMFQVLGTEHAHIWGKSGGFGGVLNIYWKYYISHMSLGSSFFQVQDVRMIRIIWEDVWCLILGAQYAVNQVSGKGSFFYFIPLKKSPGFLLLFQCLDQKRTGSTMLSSHRQKWVCLLWFEIHTSDISDHRISC